VRFAFSAAARACQAHTWRSLNAPLCKLPIPAERVRRAVLRGKPPLYCYVYYGNENAPSVLYDDDDEFEDFDAVPEYGDDDETFSTDPVGEAEV